MNKDKATKWHTQAIIPELACHDLALTLLSPDEL